MADFAEKLQDQLAARNLTANAFSKSSGVPQTTLSGYLRRVRKPSWEHVQKLARALGVSCIDLQDDPPETKPARKPKKN